MSNRFCSGAAQNLGSVGRIPQIACETNRPNSSQVAALSILRRPLLRDLPWTVIPRSIPFPRRWIQHNHSTTMTFLQRCIFRKTQKDSEKASVVQRLKALPRGPKYPTFKVPGPRNHALNGFWDQSPQILDTWTLGVSKN